MGCRRQFRDQFPVRCFGRGLLLLVIFAHLQSALAEQAAPVSPSVVLVLKLVSNTLVKPTTGIVVSDDGSVLVPAGFAAEKGEMIVLDGGTDIARNGRPAKLVDGNVAGELALLSVKGLKRPAIGLSGNLAATADALHLEAFPPAEEIAKGAPPLSLPVKILLDSQTGQNAISAETPLPYVTGAILDECGRLAGVSLVDGPQSMETGKATTVQLGADLGRLLDSLQVKLPGANCAPGPGGAVAPVAATVKQEQAASMSGPAEPATPPVREDRVETAAAEPAGAATDEPPLQATDSAKAEPVVVTRAVEAPSIWRHVPAWLLALVFIVAGGLAWKVIYFLRLKPHSQEKTAKSETLAAVQPASEEPDTAPLVNADEDMALRPRSAPVMDFEIPETATRPDGCDGLLLIEGLLDADTPFRRFCFVDTGQIDVVIGRGDADIAIEHAAISRRHARIRSDGDGLTLEDLGSRNGSFIGEVPCLAGEVMYLETGAELFLGDVKLTFKVVAQEAEWA
jgi:hypothetical protein